MADRFRIFVDANVLFSASYQPDHPFLFFWTSRKTEILTSQYAANEARRNVQTTAHLARLDRLLSETIIQYDEEERTHSEIHLPGKDAPILSGALNAKSRFLVTGDKRHFGPYFDQTFEEPYGPFTIMEPSVLLKLLKAEE
jgi:uncharacterized protein